MDNNNNGNNNISPIKKPINVNIGLIFFLVIMIYIIICVFMFLSSKHIMGYEVKTGSLSVSNVYEGIAIRDETIITSNGAGYVNYYAIEGEKVGNGNLVCSIDETGQLQDYITKDETSNNILSEKDLSEIKNDVVNFSASFDKKNFTDCYDFKYTVKNDVVKISNKTLLSSLNDITQVSSLVNLVNSPKSGIVQYYVDGYESYRPNQVCEEWFNKEKYEKQQLVANDIVSIGDPLFKLSDNENWSIVIQVEEDRAKELEEERYVLVKFLKNQYESWAKIETIKGSDNNDYCILTFSNSMITFANDRFITIELMTDVETGLKVPNSAIIEKNFFLVPERFVTIGKNEEASVLKETFNENGEMVPTNTQVSVYNLEDGEYYLDEDVLRSGDRLMMPEGDDSYTVSKSATLIGVYNINKGYADFKQIQILNSNEEYSIVKSNTAYGLVAYDYIVLDAESVETDELVYE